MPTEKKPNGALTISWLDEDWLETTLETLGGVGLAYGIHLGGHELGHHAAAQMGGATDTYMKFMTVEQGQFYFGYAGYRGLPNDRRLAVAAAGAAAEDVLFTFALEKYKDEVAENGSGSAFTKASLFFNSVNFAAYTLLATYGDPLDSTLDPNAIRKETGLSESAIVGLALGRAALRGLQVYGVHQGWPDFYPMISVDPRRGSAAVSVTIPW